MYKSKFLAIFLFLFAFYANAQVPPASFATLSRGNYLLSQKPFQIEAVVFPIRIISGTSYSNFNTSIYDKSNFTSFICWQTNLDLFPVLAQDKKWSKQSDDGQLTFLEVSKKPNLFRLQYKDDDLNPSDINLVNQAKIWFDAKRADASFNSTVLSIDLPPSGYTEPQLKDMMAKVKPDLITFNRYPWAGSTEYHPVQLLYSWYALMSTMRYYALKGNDWLGTKPTPFGQYIQTWFADNSTPPSVSQIRLNAFGGLAFGCKFLSAFKYNEHQIIDNNANLIDIPSLLFENVPVPTITNTGTPTALFHTQAEINRQVSNLGLALNKLQTKDVRFIPRSTVQQHWLEVTTPSSDMNWITTTPRPDTYLTSVTATRPGYPDDQNGSVIVGYFKSIHSTFGFVNENYFMVVNALYDQLNTVSTLQKIRLNFNFGTITTIKKLLRLNRYTGMVEVVPLTRVGSTGNIYYLDLMLDGGEGDLFKYDNGKPFLNLTKMVNIGSPIAARTTMLDAENKVEELSDGSNIIVFPNPAKNELNIKLVTAEKANIQILDLSGKLQIETQNAENIDVSQLARGLYIVKVTQGNEEYNKKFIKQ